jgi:Holliday junction resolvase
MSQPESRLQTSIQKALKRRGAFVFKIHGSEYMMSGLPDLIVCSNGLFVGLEVKMPGERPSIRQGYVHGRIKAAGGTVAVVRSVQEALDVLDRLYTAED